MNKRRLLKLADLLEADAKNKKGVKFDLAKWGRSDGETPVSVSCGTSACAVGLAVVSGAFKRAGLSNANARENGFAYSICPRMPSGNAGFDAVEELFGLKDREASFLFYKDSYPANKISGAGAERYVAKRIRDFVAGKVSAA